MSGDGVKTEHRRRARSQRNKIATGALATLGAVPQVLEPLEVTGVIPPGTTKVTLGVLALLGVAANHFWPK